MIILVDMKIAISLECRIMQYLKSYIFIKTVLYVGKCTCFLIQDSGYQMKQLILWNLNENGMGSYSFPIKTILRDIHK